jgi:hypothetical protein
MNQERWEIIKGNILDKFDVEDKGSEHIDDEGGIDIEYIVFGSPMGRMRLEFVVKPQVMDKKTTYSNRIGSETKVDYVYSETEKSEQLIAYKWDDDSGEWAEIEAKAFDR